MQNLHCTVGLSYAVMVKSTEEISQNFVVFSEYMNFKKAFARCENLRTKIFQDKKSHLLDISRKVKGKTLSLLFVKISQDSVRFFEILDILRKKISINSNH